MLSISENANSRTSDIPLTPCASDVGGDRRKRFNQMNSLILRGSIVLGDNTTLRFLTRNSLGDERQLELELRKRRKGDDSEAEVQAKQGSMLRYTCIFSSLNDGTPYNAFHGTIGRRQKMVAEHIVSFGGTLVGDAFRRQRPAFRNRYRHSVRNLQCLFAPRVCKS